MFHHVHCCADRRHMTPWQAFQLSMQVQDERFIAIAEAMLLRFASLSPVQRYALYLAAINCR
jgi:hypothetical protein